MATALTEIQKQRKEHWEWVLSSIDLIDVARDRLRGLKPEGEHWQALCPFHDDHHPSLTVNPGTADAKGPGNPYAGRFKCWVCPNVFGSVIDLVSFLDQCNPGEAVERLYADYGGPAAADKPSDSQPTKSKPAKEPKQPPDPAFLATPSRDPWYAVVWQTLDLTESHTHALLQRGLSREAVHAHGFRTLPGDDDPRRLEWVARFDDAGCDPWPSEGLPGLSTDHGGQLTGAMGLLIPAKTIAHEIGGAQIRPDKVDDHKKYRWWSSPHRAGGGAMTSIPSWIWPLDLPGTWISTPELVITEGLLKAICIAELLGIPTVGVAGFTQWDRVLPTLDTLEAETIITAFDADVWDDPKKSPVEKRCWAALRKRYPARTIQALRWDGQAKGLDDALVAGVAIHPTPVPE